MHPGRKRCAKVFIQGRQSAFGRRSILHILGRGVDARNQCRNKSQVSRRHKGDLALRIDRDAAPVEDAEIARIDQRTLGRWRREASFIAQLAKADAASQLIEHRGAPHVAFLQRRRIERQLRARLGRSGTVALGRALWRCHFGHRQDRCAGAAIKHEQLALLGRLDQRRHGFPSDGQIDQAGLGRHIVIPQIVMDSLEVPAHFSSGQVERHHRRCKAFDGGSAIATPLVGRLVAQRHINHPERFIDTGNGPAVGRIGRITGASGDRCGCVRIAGIPVPDQRTGVDVKGADHARWLGRRYIVEHGAANDDQFAGHDCRRGRVIRAGINERHVGPQVDLTLAGAKIGAWCAGCRIERQDAAIGGRHEQLGRATAGIGAGSRCCCCRGGVVRQAAASEMLQRQCTLYLRIVAPQLLAAGGVERDHALMRRANEQTVADF